MIAPLRPEDHSLNGNEYHLANELKWDSGGRIDPHGMALIEAVHQCFERDEQAVEQFKKKLAEWEQMDEPREDQNYVKGVRIDPENGEGWHKPVIENFHALPDPETEIDRTARLIVQGEYRRRAVEVGA